MLLVLDTLTNHPNVQLLGHDNDSRDDVLARLVLHQVNHEVAATAESMGYQSQHLDDLVRFFKLEESEEGNVTAVDSEFEALEFRDFSSQESIPRLSRVS